MAAPAELVRARHLGEVTVRFTQPEFDSLRALLFRRYPHLEWGTFAWCGWRVVSVGQGKAAGEGTTGGGEGLVLTYARTEPPREGSRDLHEDVGNVRFDEEYSLRMALALEQNMLAPVVLHSHPENYPPAPSYIDDDMDGYYSKYFADFGPGRPYVSLIFTEIDGGLAMSGRVWWNGEWRLVTRALVDGLDLAVWRREGRDRQKAGKAAGRHARLVAAYGEEARDRLAAASVAVIGAGGTGSAAIEVLARAGVGRLVLVDPDAIDESNLERVHGSVPADAAEKAAKVEVARRHVRAIDESCEVWTVKGLLPQREVVDLMATVNVALGCTDSHSSRLALSDMAVRYLVPAIDCGVAMEGAAGRVTGQIMQLARFLPGDACALCRNMTSPWRVAQELMSEEEKARRRIAAEEAERAGMDADVVRGYWRHAPQLLTVGYLTSAAGALAAGYAIGWITGRFEPPFERLQMNAVAPWWDVTDSRDAALSDCSCRRVRGWADQGNADAYVTAPNHWPDAILG